MQQCEDSIRRGDMPAARAHLSLLRKDDLHRDDRATVADFARRLGMHDFGLKILRSSVHPSSPRRRAATPDEKAVYAALLIKVGAVEEALSYLETPTTDVPESLLYRGYAHVAQWDYAAAIPFLQNYAELCQVSPYQKLTAQVNLAAALVFIEDFDRAEALLTTILKTTTDNGWSLLHGGALEISARSAIGRGHWSVAEARLEQASLRFQGSSNVQLFIKKWRTLLPLLQSAATQRDTERVHTLRMEAAEAHHWETVRDCDYYLALAQGDQDGFSRVFFGTPFPRFRERMLRNTKGLTAPASYFWRCGGDGGRRFDVEKGREIDGPAVMKPGQKLHLFTKALAQDFYRPSLLGNIHSRVFPGVHYDPVHSSRRISDLIRRLRVWLKENEIPLEIAVYDGAFKFHAREPIQLYLENPETRLMNPESLSLEAQLQTLMAKWPSLDFSTQDAANHLGISRRAANLLLARGTDAGRLLRVGQGPATRYRFAMRETK